MGRNFEYTAIAHQVTARFPMLTYLSIQINFWIFANLLLAAILKLHGLIISDTYNLTLGLDLKSTILIAVIFGMLYGGSLGLPSYYLNRKLFSNLSLGKIIALKAIISLIVLSLFLSLLRFFLLGFVQWSSLSGADIFLNERSWHYWFYLLIIYYFFMSLVISFINQVNKKYGPGVILPLLFGRYRNPREEERVFMFMDLRSSTTTAEKLGHLKYSAFIRDCFTDINSVLLSYRAQVYQYVGDEIVLSWPEKEGLREQHCIRFYFACSKYFEKRSDYYISRYGFLPDFKAGVHAGKVSAVEIGEIKKDIAYHGDTLNIAARIQSLCNTYNKDFLISQDVFDKIRRDIPIAGDFLGKIFLKGKTSSVGIISIESI